MIDEQPSHKVIALISGGKDSFLSILQCQEQGHEIVALANLYPPVELPREEDLNSHMYQTAGHALIPFYEQALGIPLYRAEIRGIAAQKGREYSISTLSVEDETEDLTRLLQRVLMKHPEANAVCSGAILSTYQRTRIENVCLRLKLRPLAYLWQMSLLDEIADSASITEKSSALLDHFGNVGLDARIVKVASGGLDESFLWQSLLDVKTRSRIKAAMRRFGGSVVGEGGEFETLVSDGPRSLFKGRIVVQEDGIRTRLGQGGEAFIDFETSAITVQMHESGHQDRTERKESLPGISEKGSTVLPNPKTIAPRERTTNKSTGTRSDFIFSQQEQGNLIWFNNMTCRDVELSTVQLQTEAIIQTLRTLLEKSSMTTASLVFTTIILHNMDDFKSMNEVYGELFEFPIPPARVTIAVGEAMPPGILVSISCVALRGDLSPKQGLHVQSISHWAPANIGPYSQAVSIPVRSNESTRLVYVAGQIPLVPGTMQPARYRNENPQEEFRKQTLLALRHATCIGIVMNVSYWNHAIAFVCEDQYMEASERASIALRVWQQYHERPMTPLDSEEDGPDAWDLKYGGQGSLTDDPDAVARALPSFEVLRAGSDSVPGFLAVQVEQLPKAQSVEWQLTGYSGGQVSVDENGSSSALFDEASTSPTMSTSMTFDDATLVDGQTTKSKTGRQRQDHLAYTFYMTAKAELADIGLTGGGGVALPCHRIWRVKPHSSVMEEITWAVVSQRLESQ